MRRFLPPHIVAAFLMLFTYAGSLAVADEGKTVFESDFEAGDASSLVAKTHLAKVTITQDAKEVVAGTRSLRGDSMKGGSTWNEFLVSRPGLLKAKEAYRVTFDYRVLARQGDAQFYALFRRPRGGGGNVGWQDWQGKPGDTGSVEAKLYTGNAADWSLILGIKKRGTTAIDNVRIATDPDGRPASYPLPTIARTWESPGKTSYYVDAEQGNDASDGTTPKQAWKTLAKVNQGTFAAGDRILLKRGSAWTSALTPGGQGQPGSPIVVEPYGDGPKPRIDPQGKLLAAVYLHNVSQFQLRDLDIANNGRRRQAGRRGVLVQLENFGTASGIVLSGLHIHDVTGSNVKKAGGGSGIMVRRKGTAKKSRYDGLLIENCLLERVDRNGINMAGYWTRTLSPCPSVCNLLLPAWLA